MLKNGMVFGIVIIITCCFQLIKCQGTPNKESQKVVEQHLIAGKKQTIKVNLDLPGYIDNISLSDIKCSPAPSQLTLLSTASVPTTGLTTNSSEQSRQIGIQLQHIVLRTFDQILQLSSIVDAIEFKSQIYTLLINGTILVHKYSTHKNKTAITLSAKFEAFPPQSDPQVGSFLILRNPIDSQSQNLLFLSRNLGFKVQQNGVTMIANYPPSADLFSGFASAAPLTGINKEQQNFTNLIAIAFGVEGIKIYSYYSNNKLIELKQVKQLIEDKLVEVHRSINNEENTTLYEVQNKDYQVLSFISLNDNDYLLALEALKGLTVFRVKVKISTTNNTKQSEDKMSVTLQIIHTDQHSNRNGECENIAIAGELVYYSCQHIYSVNITQIQQNYDQIISSKEIPKKTLLARRFDRHGQESFVISIESHNNYLVITTHNSFNLYWHQHPISSYVTSNIEKVILLPANNSIGFRVLIATPATITLVQPTVDRSSLSGHWVKFQCQSDFKLKTGQYKGQLNLQTQCNSTLQSTEQSTSNSICTQTIPLIMKVTNQQDKKILIIIGGIVILLVIAIGGVIAYLVCEIRILNLRKRSMKGKQYSTMLQEKQGQLQLELQSKNQNSQQLKDRHPQLIFKSSSEQHQHIETDNAEQQRIASEKQIQTEDFLQKSQN